MFSPIKDATNIFTKHFSVNLKFPDNWNKAPCVKHEPLCVQTQRKNLIQILGENRTQLKASTGGWSSSFFGIVF